MQNCYSILILLFFLSGCSSESPNIEQPDAQSEEEETLGWVRTYSGPENDYVHDIEIATDGTIYTAGTFRNSIDLGLSAPLVVEDAQFGNFLIKSNTDGSTIWSARTPGSALSIAATRDGGVVAVFQSDGIGTTVEVAGVVQNLPDFRHLFMIHVAADASFQILQAIPGRHFTTDIAIDPETGQIVLAGSVMDAVDFGDGEVSENSGYLAVYNSEGQFEWSQSTSFFWPDAVKVSSGVIAASGGLLFSTELGNEPNTVTLDISNELPFGTGNLAVSSWTIGGQLLWAEQIAAERLGPTGLAIDKTGRVFVAGLFNGEAWFGAEGQTRIQGIYHFEEKEGVDSYVAAYGSNGALQWVSNSETLMASTLIFNATLVGPELIVSGVTYGSPLIRAGNAAIQLDPGGSRAGGVGFRAAYNLDGTLAEAQALSKPTGTLVIRAMATREDLVYIGGTFRGMPIADWGVPDEQAPLSSEKNDAFIGLLK